MKRRLTHLIPLIRKSRSGAILNLLPISLGVRKMPDAGAAVSSGRLPSKEQIEKTLWRDGHACRCCGFESKKFQRVVSLRGGASFDDASLISVCSFCELCFTLDRAGLMGGGTLIWLPEMAQADLNHLVRAIYVAKASENELSAPASQALELLLSRRVDAKKRLGTDDPLILATALQEQVDETAYADRAAKLDGIRLLPADRYLIRKGGADINIFPQMISYWTSSEGPFAIWPVAEWGSMFAEIEDKVKT